MKCQNCGAHEATIKYMQMINGEKDERNKNNSIAPIESIPNKAR